MSRGFDRRTFFKVASLAYGAAASATDAARAAVGTVAGTAGNASRHPASRDDAARVQWLDQPPPVTGFTGATWGIPWPRGTVAATSTFSLRSDARRVDLQSWPLAYWPDGSLKWSAHALAPRGFDALDNRDASASFVVEPNMTSADVANGPALVPIARRVGDAIEIDTGLLQGTIPVAGERVFVSLTRNGGAALQDGRLVVLADERDPAQAGRDDDDNDNDNETSLPARRRYRGRIDRATLEQNGPARALVKLEGTHFIESSSNTGGATLLPFVLRLYFYRDSDAVRLVHSLVYDADPRRTFIRGVGLRFGKPLQGEAHERFVRFVGDNGGVFAEAVRGLTGLRRTPGHAVESAQFEGEATPPADALGKIFARDLRFVPAWGDYTLLQSNADGFTIDKRTQGGCGWVRSANGTRASGTGYLGALDGGVAFGIRHFWQSHPGQIDIRNAHTSNATVTLWLWAPDAPAMDLRPYHDGMGETTYALQRDALDITYEDYEPGFMTPYGVARTSEIELQLLPATPSHAALAAIAQRIETPPRLIASRAWMYRAEAFSQYWRPAHEAAAHAASNGVSNAELGRTQQGLDWNYDFYRGQIEQRKWYGFWDFGDVMHTYDSTRHVWRYDVGGFAWDNGELSTDIWLWHYWLQSGRADAFHTAEAMTRHGSEVDVHHIGPFSPLGSRHDVQHWGDSAKQLRVSTVTNHRFYYYLTADERVGDLMHAQADAVERLRDILPGRKIDEPYPAVDREHHATVSFGTDWGAVAAAWLTEWERTQSQVYRDRLVASMESIAAQPHGFFTGYGVMDLRTGRFAPDMSGAMSVSHLSAVFGLPEVCGELFRLLDVPAFREAWLQYCTLYSASAEEQQAALGKPLGKLNLNQGHARLLAFAGHETGDAALCRRAWQQFFAGRAGSTFSDFHTERVRVPDVLYDVDEAPRVSTNSSAQWGLGAIGLLALAVDNG
ncbi:Tat pathway signal sequence domain protein [Paraburkholderia sp. BCC1886]|uniref:exo-rhamnogalacturonan lyase family protein n=1 Tax=Paraburkholderia sp. BCC1886 TaxID=2562670 RepID=UPI001182BF77|nr:Tat pathway signal sequence domain protein [Paraburkholderia sp. BCC1886]